MTDRRSGHEIIDCIQAFLDARQHALVQGKQATYHTRTQEESQSSEFSAMGIDFDDEDLLALDQGALSKESLMDVEVAQVRTDLLCTTVLLLMHCAIADLARTHFAWNL